MVREVRPLWQLLLETAKRSNNKRPLTCSECFEILDYFAEHFQRNEKGFELSVLQKTAKRHLSTCPDCQAYYQKRLQELEEKLE